MLNKEEVKEVIKKHLVDLDVNLELEEEDAKLLDMIGDSLDLIDLVMRVEKDLNITIDDDSVEEISQLNLEQASEQICKIYLKS